MLQVLLPILNDIEDGLGSVKSDLSHLNESIWNLSRGLEEHKNQTATELADLYSSLQSAIDSNSQNLTLLHAKMDTLDSKLNSSNSHISTQFDSLERHIEGMIDPLDSKLYNLSREFEKHENQMATELADLRTTFHSDINTNSDQLTQLGGKMNTLNTKIISVSADMSENFNSLESQVNTMINPLNTKLCTVDSTTSRMSDDLRCVKTDLNNLNESVIKQSRHLEEHKNEMTSKLVNVNMSVSNLVCNKFSFFKDSISSELVAIDQHLQQNFTKLLNCCKCRPIHTCGGTGGWRQVVNLDMTDNRTECPEGWNMTDYSKRTCGRASRGIDPYGGSCDSVTYPVCGGEYSHVCGRIKAYHWGYTAAFRGSFSVDDTYFSGVAVMHGSPRQHIWTFAAGAAENWMGGQNSFLCPCDIKFHFLASVPPFVGEDYFCESGTDLPYRSIMTFHVNDTLWDGKDCHSSSTCCSLHNPPFFTKTLNTSTTDDLELRMCLFHSISRMNIAVELIELYVK